MLVRSRLTRSPLLPRFSQMNARHCALVLSAGMIASTAVAGSNGYQCAITSESQLQGDGSLGRPRKDSALGKRFAVDRRTGAMVEPDGEYWSFGGAEPSVIARGNSENSFVSVVTSPARTSGVHAAFLRVQEYEDTKLKPFVLVAGGLVYTGMCE